MSQFTAVLCCTRTWLDDITVQVWFSTLQQINILHIYCCDPDKHGEFNAEDSFLGTFCRVTFSNALDYRANALLTLTLTIGVRASGAGGLQPPDSGKTIIFRAKAKFFGQKPAAKNENFFCVFIKQKTEFILSSEIKCPKSGIFGWVSRAK